jgi:hypothetical protein
MARETTESSFDELARGLASGTLSRGRALRLLGGVLVGSALASVVPGAAWADDDCRGFGRRCRRDRQCCSGNCIRRGDEKVCGCPEDKTRCGLRCINLQTDERHCGSCSNRCADGAECVDGVCQDAGPICTPSCTIGSACYANQDGTTFCACGFSMCTNDCSACAPGQTCALNPQCPTPFQCVTPC